MPPHPAREPHARPRGTAAGARRKYEPLVPARSRWHAGTWHGPHGGSGRVCGSARNTSSGTLSTSRCCRRWARHNRSPDVFHGRGQPSTAHRDGGWHGGSGSSQTASRPSPALASRRWHRWQTRARPNAVAWHPGARQTGRPSSGCSGGGASSRCRESQPTSVRKAGSISRSKTATASSAAPETGDAAARSHTAACAGVTGPARQDRGANRLAPQRPAAAQDRDERRSAWKTPRNGRSARRSRRWRRRSQPGCRPSRAAADAGLPGGQARPAGTRRQPER